jgi:hypothetical protein
MLYGWTVYRAGLALAAVVWRPLDHIAIRAEVSATTTLIRKPPDHAAAYVRHQTDDLTPICFNSPSPRLQASFYALDFFCSVPFLWSRYGR